MPSVLIAGLGVVAGTSIDMTDPQTAIAEILPSWLYPIFLLAIIVGTLANNVLCSYSTGLYAQAFVPRIRRSVSVLIVGVVAAVLAAYLLYGAPAFLDTLSYAIEIAVAVMGPLVAIYAIDIVLRRASLRRPRAERHEQEQPVLVLPRLVPPGRGGDAGRDHGRGSHGQHDPVHGPHFDGARWSGSVVARGPRARLPGCTRCSGAPRAPTATPPRVPQLAWADARHPGAHERRSAQDEITRRCGRRSGRAREECTMTWTMPAEFSTQERVWMAFPRVGNTLGDDAASADLARDTWAAVANAAAGFEPVTMVVDPSAVAEARKRLSSEIDLVEAPLDDYWMRDIGPTFVVDEAGTLGAVDWTFNGWGANAWATWERDNRIAHTVAELAGAAHLPSPLVNEGGGIHVDGEGTVLLTETVQLDPRRNPYSTKERVEWELQRTIGATRCIWLPRGLTRDYESAGTRGHVDMVATFAAPGRVLLHWQDDPSHPDTSGRARGARSARTGDGCRGSPSRDHRAARAADAAR